MTECEVYARFYTSEDAAIVNRAALYTVN